MSEPEEDFAAMFAASHAGEAVRQGPDHRGHHRRHRAGGGVRRRRRQGRGGRRRRRAEETPTALIEVCGRRSHPGDRRVDSRRADALARKLARGHVTDQQLTDAYHSGLPVEGKVERTVKGGYEVRLARQRAFCPFSQIDIARTADPEAHVGRVYAFRIIEYKEGGRNLIVSRRKVLEEEQQARAAEVRRVDRARRRADRPRGLGARVRRLRRSRRRRPGPAARVRDRLVARLGSVRRCSSPATRSPSRCFASTTTAGRLRSG